MVTDEQVRLLRKNRMKGQTQQAAAASAGMSERTARNWENGPLPSQAKKPRTWRTKEDAFEDVWETEMVPLLKADKKGVLRCPTLLRHLQENHSKKQFPDSLLRTLQRRVSDWRALHGPGKEVFFPQEHRPGREAAIDFTHGTELGVTILGEPFKHLLFEFKLSFSGWTHVSLAYGETFEALVEGLQTALWQLGGVPQLVRHDSLSAATHELKRSKGRSLTKRFQDVLDHYRLESSRINVRKAHENGVAEKAHDLLKSALAQQLLLRGSSDFDSVALYMSFVQSVVQEVLHRDIEHLLPQEKAALRPLPPGPVPNYTSHDVKVHKWSIIRVARRVYSVPSRLIGHQVQVHQYANHLEVSYKGSLIEKMPRLRGQREVRIDYRHVIHSLVRKPGAFANYRYREELFPSLVFRMAYDALVGWRGERADVEYVRILHLAATTMESAVQATLERRLQTGEKFDYVDIKEEVSPEPQEVPHLSIPAPDLAFYDQLLQEL